jgi:hypothetical protein
VGGLAIRGGLSLDVFAEPMTSQTCARPVSGAGEESVCIVAACQPHASARRTISV